MARIAAFFRLALILALVGGFGLCGLSPIVQAREACRDSSVGAVAPADLPLEARQTLHLIQQGGPFPYPHKDGSTFGNFERCLPLQARGYYREYTVPTPGRSDRGARRIVVGNGRNGDVTTSREYFYTADHYRSFRRIREP